MRNSNKGRNYNEIKETWQQEKYLSILDEKKSKAIFKYRTANHRLPVETGRFRNIEYKDRLCQECFRDIGDEFHYMLQCPIFDSDRKKISFEKPYKIPEYDNF